MNVNFGMSDYGRMRFMLQIADVFRVQKKWETVLKEDKGKSDKCTAEIKKQ